MKGMRLIMMVLLAAVVGMTACDPAEKGGEVKAPTVNLTLNVEEVYEDAFMAFAATTDAEKASWKVVNHGMEGVTAESVFAEGTEIPADQLNGEEPAMILVEDLEASTKYDLYVAVENKGKKVLSEPLTVTTAEAAPAFGTVVEFNPVMCSGQNLAQMIGSPGHWLTLMSEDNNMMMQIMIVDCTVDGSEYQYLSGQVYPAVTAGTTEMGAPEIPEVSSVVCNPMFSNLYVYDEASDTGVTYLFKGEAGTDKDGKPYGVEIITKMPEEDDNMITFNLVAYAVDEDGNTVEGEVLITGSYKGSMGYPAAAAPIEFDLEEWGYTNYKATVEGTKVTLLSGGPSGDFKIVVDTKNYNGELASADGNLYVVGDNLEGYFFDPLDFAEYNFTEGGFVLSYGEAANTFKLEVGDRRGWKMAGGTKQFSITPKVYTITVEGLEPQGGSNSTEDVGKDNENQIVL